MRESNQDKRVLLHASIGLPRRLEEEGRKVGEAEGGGGWRTRSKACVANLTSSPAKLDERESDDKTTKGEEKNCDGKL